MPDFDKYNKKMKQEYEDAFKEVCDDLMNGVFDNWTVGFLGSEYSYNRKVGNISGKYTIPFNSNGEPDPSKVHECKKNIYEEDGFDFTLVGHEKISKNETDFVYKNIRKLTDTPYNNLLKLLQPIWVDEKIPLLKKHEEVKKAFDNFLYGEESEKPEIKESAEVIEKRTIDRQIKKKSGKLSSEQEKELQLIYATGVRKEIAKAKDIIISALKKKGERNSFHPYESRELHENIKQLPLIMKYFNDMAVHKLIECLIDKKSMPPSDLFDRIGAVKYLCGIEEIHNKKKK